MQNRIVEAISKLDNLNISLIKIKDVATLTNHYLKEGDNEKSAIKMMDYLNRCMPVVCYTPVISRYWIDALTDDIELLEDYANKMIGILIDGYRPENIQKNFKMIFNIFFHMDKERKK